MSINQFSLVIGILIFVFNDVYGQINPERINQKLLEHEIKTLIDSTRSSHGLPALFNDSILYLAAQHHAEYLLDKGELSHNEPENKPFYSPQDRAKSYGASNRYFVGENVAFSVYNTSVKVKSKRFNTSTYKGLARSLVYSWVNSKGHFKNIINPDYQVTGLAIAVDTSTNRVYACQKFAHVIYTYTFTENKEMFPYTNLDPEEILKLQYLVPSRNKYPHKLKDNKTELCLSCKGYWENSPPISVRIKRNYFILRIENTEFVKQLIQNKHDGFAIEIVPFDAFACGNPAYQLEPSRRNGALRTSGQLLEPVYRADLMKGFKRRKKAKDISFVDHILRADSIAFFKRFKHHQLVKYNAKYFEIKLGKVPKNIKGWWNHNLVYIHDKQLCHFTYLTNYPGELSTSFIEVDYFPPVPINDYNFEIDYYIDSMELLFKAGETKHSGENIKTIITNLKNKNLKIENISIEGYSSVEGDPRINEKLHETRAQNILKLLEPYTDSLTSYKIESNIAWEHFYKNVENHSKWHFLSEMNKAEVSNYLSAHQNERPTEILNQERKVKVIIKSVRPLSPENANYYVMRDIKSLFYKDERGEIMCKDNKRLEKIYEKAYYFSKVDTLTKEAFLAIEIPKAKNGISHTLDHHLAFYHYDYLKNSDDKAKIKKAKYAIESVFMMCGAPDHLSPEFHYLSACLLIEKLQEKGTKISPKDPGIQKAFNRLNLLLSSYDLSDSLMMNVSKANLNIINALVQNIGEEQIYEYSDIVNKSLIQIISYYRRMDQLEPKLVLQLAKMLCYFKNIPLAAALCSEFLDDDEILKLYLPLAYTHSSFLSSDEGLAFENYFHQLIFEAKERFSNDDWCGLFYGKFGIPFQVMDHSPIRDLFCSSCPNRVNEVLGKGE